MSRSIRFLFCAAAMCFFLGCAGEAEQTAGETQEKEAEIQIGMSFDSFVIERWQRDRDAFVAKATKELGAEVNIQNAGGDPEQQIRQIQYLMDKNVDVLVIIPTDGEKISEAVQEAKKQGIAVIAYDRIIPDADVDLYISFDNQEVGRLMGESVAEAVGAGGRVLMACGPLEDRNVPQVMEGFQTVIQEAGLSVIGESHADAWLAETGYDFVRNFLETDTDVDAIMCGNDDIAGQVVRALSEQRLAGKVCVVGQDADLQACQRIVEGTQMMTVYKPVEKLATLAAEYAVALAEGGVIPVEKTFFDGSYEVPYVGLTPIAVTKDNMQVIIDDGFHLEEDIYLNIPERREEEIG